MSIKQVKVHRMYEEFHEFPIIQYIGEYSQSKHLINVFNSFNQRLTCILGTYQWELVGSEQVFFVEEDYGNYFA